MIRPPAGEVYNNVGEGNRKIESLPLPVTQTHANVKQG
jgi:hypothetical protein